MVFRVLKHLKRLFKTANQWGVTLMYDAGMSLPFKICLDIYFIGRAKDKVRTGYEFCRSLPNCNPLNSRISTEVVSSWSLMDQIRD